MVLFFLTIKEYIIRKFFFFLFNSFLKFFSFNPNNRRRRSKNREKKRERERGVDEEVFSLRKIVTFIKSYYSSSSFLLS